MNPMVPGLTQGGKMSASDPNSKIDLLEEPKQVKKRLVLLLPLLALLKETALFRLSNMLFCPFLKSPPESLFSTLTVQSNTVAH